MKNNRLNNAIYKIRLWCYGGFDKKFFKEHKTAIMRYNESVIYAILIIMPFVLALYFVMSLISTNLSNYSSMYAAFFLCFISLLLFDKFAVKGKDKPLVSNIVTVLTITLLFVFVCLIGTYFDYKSLAVMFLVYILCLPMLMIVPTHNMYAFLLVCFAIFTIADCHTKTALLVYMDFSHCITCIAIGIFISHFILQNRLSLFAANEKLSQLSYYDTLTDIPNRRGLKEYFDNNYSQNDEFFIAILDIDDFKKYNDTYGHLNGDVILADIAKALEEHAKKSNCFAARFGGEEFIFTGSPCRGLDFIDLLEGYRCDIFNRNIAHSTSNTGRVTLSIGYAKKNDGEDVQSVLKRADDALYLAKSKGKNCIAFSDDSVLDIL